MRECMNAWIIEYGDVWMPARRNGVAAGLNDKMIE